jgi:hypothetical protein
VQSAPNLLGIAVTYTHICEHGFLHDGLTMQDHLRIEYNFT